MQSLHGKAWVVLLSAGIALFALQTLALADGHVPAAHQVIQQYDGPATCAGCHPGAAEEVVNSLHYQMRGEAPFRVDWEVGKLGGMNGTY